MNADFAQTLEWIDHHMPRTRRALAALPRLDGRRIAFSMHLDEKVVPALLGLRARGADLFITTCNPATVRGQVTDHLRRTPGITVHARPGMTPADYEAAITAALAWDPTHLCEMGADLTYAGHQQAAGPAVQAALEATGSGINRLQGLSLRYPVYNWDDLPIKEGLHNRHMVGLTTWHTFFNTTQLTLHEKHVVVVGFGSVGQGLARVAHAYGGRVTVVDKDPVRALEASYEGWPIATLEEALPAADVVVTATGAAAVLNAAHWPRLRPGVFLLNVGHRADEIDVPALQAFAARQLKPHITAYDLPQGAIYLLAGGFMFNLTAGQGDSLNAFDLTLALMVAGIGFLTQPAAAAAAPGVYLLPPAVWRPLAAPPTLWPEK